MKGPTRRSQPRLQLPRSSPGAPARSAPARPGWRSGDRHHERARAAACRVRRSSAAPWSSAGEDYRCRRDGHHPGGRARHRRRGQSRHAWASSTRNTARHRRDPAVGRRHRRPGDDRSGRRRGVHRRRRVQSPLDRDPGDARRRHHARARAARRTGHVLGAGRRHGPRGARAGQRDAGAGGDAGRARRGRRRWPAGRAERRCCGCARRSRMPATSSSTGRRSTPASGATTRAAGSTSRRFSRCSRGSAARRPGQPRERPARRHAAGRRLQAAPRADGRRRGLDGGRRDREAEGPRWCVKPLTNLPSFDSLGATLENAARLAGAGAVVALSSFDTTTGRHAAAGGRQRDRLRAGARPRARGRDACTRARSGARPARVGSLEPGKDADLVVWSGDPFELSSHAERVFIRGREMPMTTRQTELLERYKTLERR
jgi:hypothetical protein